VTGADDPDQRYWAAVALGSTGDERAVATLERMVAGDRGVTVFDGEVRVAAKKGLRTLRRIQTAIAVRATASATGEDAGAHNAGRARQSTEARRSRSSRDG
jgi:hypothetical protein